MGSIQGSKFEHLGGSISPIGECFVIRSSQCRILTLYLKGGYRPTSTEDQYQDAVDDTSTRNSRRGTIRLVHSQENTPLATDAVNHSNVMTERESLGADIENHSSGLPFSSSTREAEQRPVDSTPSFSPYAQETADGRQSQSSDSDDSFTRNQNRESTGFREAVLAALGFSSGHSRPNSGVAGTGPTDETPTSSHAPQAQAGFDSGSNYDAPRDAQPELFSLPPTDTAHSLDRLATVGLGLNYLTSQTESQMSHPSHSDTWDALYRQHSADLDLDSDMLDFSSPSRMSNSRSGSGSVFASAHTPASTNRSPAMMSTGPMPHSEQFHYETDEPVPDIPDNKLPDTVWSQEDRREIALFSTAFSSPESPRSAEPDTRPFDTNFPPNVTRPSTTAPAVSSNFPLPPVRQIATSPRGLRPRPSAGTLRQMADSASDSAALDKPHEVSRKPVFLSEPGGDLQRRPENTVTSPSVSAFSRPDLFSPKSVISTNTFGGDIAGDPGRLPNAGVMSPDSSNDAAREHRSVGTDFGSRSRLSHLFADAHQRSSVISSVEPMSGNTFSSFRQQQEHQDSGEPASRVNDHSAGTSRRLNENADDLTDRWSMSSFPGQPIVPAEVYQRAVSSDTTTNSLAHDAPPRNHQRSRPLPIPTPISTRSPIEVQNEYARGDEGDAEDSGVWRSNLAMGDASGTAKVS